MKAGSEHRVATLRACGLDPKGASKAGLRGDFLFAGQARNKNRVNMAME